MIDPDVDALRAHVRKMLDRLGIDRRGYVLRMRTFAKCAETLVQPKGPIDIALRGFTQAELNGGMWLLLIADVFREEDEGARFANELVGLTQEEWSDVLRITTAISTRYFGQ